MSNLNINWKTPNITIIELDEDFVGQELEIVEKHPKVTKRMLKLMGIRDTEDQDQVIQKIKILVSKADDPTDVWDKQDGEDKSKPKSQDWN